MRICYRGNVSTEPLPSNDKGILTEPNGYCWAVSPEAMRSKRLADHPSPPSASVKIVAPSTSSRRDAKQNAGQCFALQVMLAPLKMMIDVNNTYEPYTICTARSG
jgi:hypothetical protein